MMTGITVFFIVFGLLSPALTLPKESRIRRQSSSEAGAFAGAGASAGSSSQSDEYRGNGNGGMGAIASTLGGRVGAGCSGLSCGFRLGDFAYATPNLLGGQNFRNVYPNSGSYRNPYEEYNSYSGESEYNSSPNLQYDYGYENDNNSPYNYPQSLRSSSHFDLGNFLQRPFQFVQQFMQNQGGGYDPQQQSNAVADFARIGGGSGGFSGGSGNGGLFSGSAGTSSFSSSSGNGKPVFNSVSTHVGPDGQVTTVERGSDTPDKISTGRIGNTPGASGVFASSGTKVDSDGNVQSFRNVGTL